LNAAIRPLSSLTILARAHDSITNNLLFSIPYILRRLVLDPEDYQEYAHFNSSKNYTRNLIATDRKSYTLMLLCWNAGKSSPIHDHPCDGCWMRVVMGSVQECRYNKLNSDEECLTCVSNDIYTEGQQAFIQDSMGYHKVGNPSHSKPAITLHLYCPPFETCKIWMDPHDSVASCTKSNVCYHSEYGFVV
jgi:cysteine dioxygenase